MEKIWEKFSAIKDDITRLATNARDNGWLEQGEYDGIIERVRNDVLTIGVIGQMKSGKSTFLNAFLFKDNILPVASTPMTAALSVITHGEKAEVSAEFYTKNEWQEIEERAASYTGEENEDPSVKAAKELKEKSTALGNQIAGLLGQTKSADLSRLSEYVGADGRFTPVTKQVTIKLNDDRLKGVRIVDTPGFNDPVVSREERTRMFLNEADAVVLLLYAGRAFDMTDRDILFEKVRNVGVGKIIVGVNKYDLAVAEGELEANLKKFVSDAIEKEVGKLGDNVLRRLLTGLDPVLLSASMALFAAMPKEKIDADETLKWHYDKICADFEIRSKEKLYELSRMENLEREIDAVLGREKIEILVRKPVNVIQARIKAKKELLESEMTQTSEKLKNISMPNEELERKEKKLNRARGRIETAFDDAKIEVNEFLYKEIIEADRNLRKLLSQWRDKFHKIIDEEKIWNVDKKLKIEQKECSFELAEKFDSFYGRVKKKMSSVIDAALLDAEEIFANISDEEDWEDASKRLFTDCKGELQRFNKLSFEDVVAGMGLEKKGSAGGRFALDALIVIGAGLIGLGIKKLVQILTEQKCRREAKEKVDVIFSKINVAEGLDPVKEHADGIFVFFRDKFSKNLLDKIIADIETMKFAEFDREREKERLEAESASLKEKVALIGTHLAELEKYIAGMSV